MEPLPSPSDTSRCLLHGQPLTVIEFYSGIGGVSYAFRNLTQEAAITSFDVNDVANDVHSFNFPEKKVLSRNLTGITASELEEYAADVWTMSPPCQPFTRLGLQKDVDDNRTDSFLHLIESVLPAIRQKPSFLLIENVKGFETSQTHTIVMSILKRLKYHCREFLLSPFQIGIPNSRLRYYLIARLEHAFPFGTDETVIETVPSVHQQVPCIKCCRVIDCHADNGEVRKLQSFLSEQIESCFLLTEKHLGYTQGLDIVTKNSTRTCCFTRGYGHLLLGAGSVLQMNDNLDAHQIMLRIRDHNDGEKITRLKELGLRFFTPQEVANLMCFPSDFRFPDHITNNQKYRLLGNSVNVNVILLMLQILFIK